MSESFAQEDVKACVRCGALMTRERLGSNFNKNRYCSLPCFKETLRKNPVAAFLEKIDKGPHPKGCWLWTGAKENHGYGHFRHGSKDYRAHRYGYQLAKGPIPKGMHVLHSCDVMPCVNPAHLRLGTHAENMADCKAKGRQTYGERNPSATMTAETALKLRAEYRRTARNRSNAKELAAKYGIRYATVAAVIARRSWRHI